MFVLNFFKPKLIDRKYGATFNQLFSLRLTGDYEDRRNLDLQAHVVPLVDPAKNLIDTVSELAKQKVK